MRRIVLCGQRLRIVPPLVELSLRLGLLLLLADDLLGLLLVDVLLGLLLDVGIRRRKEFPICLSLYFRRHP